jgi:hypothetical protein
VKGDWTERLLGIWERAKILMWVWPLRWMLLWLLVDMFYIFLDPAVRRGQAVRYL